MGCPELSLEEIVALAKQHGLEQLELRTVSGRVDLPALFSETLGTPGALAAYLAREEMKLCSLDTSLKLVGNSEEDRATFLEFIPWAEATGAPYLRIFDGGTFSSELSEEDLKSCLETIRWWRSMRDASGWKVDIMVETHDCLTSTRAVQQLQAELEVPVPILWDTHHTWKKGNESPPDTWEALKEFIVHVHIKDSISKPSARHPFTYVMLGQGEFDLEESLNLLSDAGFKGPVSLEWERQWHPYLPPLNDALTKARTLGWW